MGKTKTRYVCQKCGYESRKWLGRCGGCDEWNTLVEEQVVPEATASPQSGPLGTGALRDEFKLARLEREAALDQFGVQGVTQADVKAMKAWEFLDADESESGDSNPSGAYSRYATGMGELDRVLGGGLVPDSFVLLGGDPGIGKSTLLLQTAKGLREKDSGLKILYVSGEESVEQIRSRAKRIGVKGEGKVFLAAETQLEKVFATVKEVKPHVLIMDSLQTFSSQFLQSAPGSVSQLREIAARLMALAKTAGIAVFLVGHVTKDGAIAGPKVVEHMVDTVLYFESDGGQTYRLLRTVKNRFGSAQELGIFEMSGDGLREVSNPSSLFLSERSGSVSGTAVATSLEGSRPLLVEMQALVVDSPLSMPRRTSVGVESSRVALLAAILERHMDLVLGQQDLFFNVAGGLRLSEPATDLAAAAAIWSSANRVPLPASWVFIGELGLTGEVRRVNHIEMRIEEAKKLGFTKAVIPAGTPKRVLLRYADAEESGIELMPLQRVDELGSMIRDA